MINKFPSQYIPNSKLIEILSKVTKTDPTIHIYKKRKNMIKEISELPRFDILNHITLQEINYLLKSLNKTTKLPVFLSEEDINKMLEIVRKKQDIRSEILILFLFNTGCRPGEAAQTKVKDIDFVNKFTLVRKSKAKKERTAHFFDDKFLDYLRYYINNKNPGDYLFLSNWNKPYTVKGITKLLKSIAKRAGLDPKRISAHKFRHTHAVHALKSGVNIASIRDQLGHSNISITDEYTKIVDSVRRNDYEKHNPFSLSKNQIDANFCKKCGLKIQQNSAFCSGCGQKLT
ncbi:hypothetical protein COV14_03060 [Candidatus Woesearchaeota archaeon CG10_big_fil_rev_8_21_14_0_10_33_12]|nr:MAG: hypothetical protein COV14_03060 [Candidatus Woesearchaeota archaeon CG10_big_fil_rev_8_21_14_0_10_33_12]